LGPYSEVIQSITINGPTGSDYILGTWKPYKYAVWSNDTEFVGDWFMYTAGGGRVCLDDDRFTFTSSTFSTSHGSDTWVEGRQGDSDSCGTPIAPYIDGDFTYSISGDNLKLVGAGAYLMLPKAVNGSESGSADERTYVVKSINDTDVKLSINVGGNFWNIWLQKI